MKPFLAGTLFGVIAFFIIACSISAPVALAAAPTSQYPILLYAEEPAAPVAQELYTDFPEEHMEEAAGAVFDGFHIEMTAWYVCVDEAKVYSNPGEDPNWYLYTLKEGDPVTVRELDLGTRTFAAVKLANFTKLTNLCPVEEG
jgi:hypothetical protein